MSIESTEPTSKNQAASDVSAWKKQAQGVLLDVPSGNTCRVRPLGGMQVFVEQGLIPNSLMGAVREALKGKEDFDGTKMAESLLDDPAQVGQMMELIDNAVCFSVIEPRVHKIPMVQNPDTNEWEQIPFGDNRRDPEKLYVDEVDVNDKMFIFQYMTGGTKSLERFREEQAKAMGTLENVQRVADEA